MVDVTTYSEARQNLAELLDRVVQNQEPVIVARKKRGSVVLVSLAEWNSLQETLHLMGTRANARALLDALDAADRRQFATETTRADLRALVREGKTPAARQSGKRIAMKRRRKSPPRVQREAAE